MLLSFYGFLSRFHNFYTQEAILYQKCIGLLGNSSVVLLIKVFFGFVFMTILGRVR